MELHHEIKIKTLQESSRVSLSCSLSGKCSPPVGDGIKQFALCGYLFSTSVMFESMCSLTQSESQ